MHPFKSLGAVLTMSLAACGSPDADPASAAATAERPAAMPSPQNATTGSSDTAPRTAPMPNPDFFIPSGWKALEKLRGDLTGGGRSDALLVASPPAADGEKLGEGEPRTVILLKQDAAGLLHPVAENRRIVPCARCGGLAGDPYAYSRIEKGGFTLSISGGSRERWADDYSFRYAPDADTWVLDKVIREITDTESDQQRKLELTTKDFGRIPFESFDPGKLAKLGPLDATEGAPTN